MKRDLRRTMSLLVLGLVLICIVGGMIEAQFKTLQRLYDTLVLDNRNHYLSCEELPTQREVEGIVEQHQAVIGQIQQVAPGFTGVEIDTSLCAGKADLLIWYGTHQQRIVIENIIADETFFGVPYRLQNR